MISRSHRFHGHGSLKFVYQNGKAVRGSLSSLKFVTNPRRKSYRLAVVVSKKVSKSAVTRNRIRRRLYEAVRRYEESFERPYDMILTVFSENMAHLPANDIIATVENHLKDAKIIK